MNFEKKELKRDMGLTRMGRWLVFAFLLGLSGGSYAFGEASKVAPAVEKKQNFKDDLGITIYSKNGDLSKGEPGSIAAIHEVRQLNLNAGENKVSIEGLSDTILPESFYILILDPALKVEVLEQYFSSSLYGVKSMLNNSIGKDIFIRQSGVEVNRSKFHKARLLSVDPQVVVEEEGTIYSVTPDQVVFQKGVAAVEGKPSLSITLESPKSQVVPLEVNYLAKGLQWVAYYIGELNENESSINIDGWVSILNNSRGEYTKAQVQLSAFNPLEADSGHQASESSVIYRIEKPITLGSFQEKKVRLFRIINLPLTLDYRLKGIHDFSQNQVGQEIPISVEKWGTLERPVEFRDIIPEGQLRLYKRTGFEAIEFLGETRLRERGGAKQIPFLIGNTKEIQATRIQTDFKQLYHNAYEAGYLYNFLNTSSSPIDVKIFLKLPRDGKLLKESLSHDSLGEETIQWVVQLPPHKNIEFRYRVRVPVSESEEQVGLQ